MKRISLLVLFLIFSVMLQAQTDTIRPPRPKVGVVMGGGGARGASHIGVLKYIEDMGIPVDYVAGTSMGSIIGGFYAMGYSPDELAQLIAHMDWSAYIGNKIDRPMMSEEMRRRNSTLLVNVPFSLKTFFDKDPNTKFISQLPSAYVNNSSLINLFNDLCVGYQEEMDFNDLPIPFACVATDIVSGNEVVLRNGSVPAAMRASMAIPGVFSPVTIGDMVLVDGGLVNNFPADVLREMGADIIIGIEITAENKVTPDDIKSLPQLLGRLVVNSTSSKRKENRDMCDLYIVPDVSGYGMLSFTPEAIDTLVDRGYKKAATYHDQFLAIKQYIDKEAGHPVTKELRAPKSHNLMDESVLISSIDISHASGKESRWLMRKGGLKIGNSYSKNDIEHAISIFRGTGCFDEVTYTVKECDSIHSRETLSDAYALTIDMKSAQPHVVGLGVHYDTEDGAALLLNVGFNAKKFGGSKFNADLRLSYNPKINFTYTYSQPSLANFSLAYDYRNEHFRMVNDSEHAINLRYQQNRISAYISQFHLLNFSTRVGLSYSTTKYDLTSLEESFMDTTYFRTNKLLTPFVNMTYDNLDDAYFAKHGIKASLTGRYHFDMDPLTINLGYVPEPSSSRYFDLSYAFQAYITPGHGKLTIIPQFYGGHVTGKPYYFNLWNVFGGDIAGRHFEDQMPFIGLTGVSSTVDNANILRCDLRYNFYGNHYLTASYNFLAYTGYLFNSGMSLSKVFSFDVQGAGLKYSYNSILGPISLTAQWSRNNDDDLFGAYFSFGYSF